MSDELLITMKDKGIAILSENIKKKHAYYLLRETANGTLVLEPAVVMPIGGQYEPFIDPEA